MTGGALVAGLRQASDELAAALRRLDAVRPVTCRCGRVLPVRLDDAVTVSVVASARGRIQTVADTPLPGWARALGCASWGQVFLTFILSHPAVTCIIPGTRKPKHMADNLGAGRGRLPDEGERREIVRRWQEV